VNHPPRGRSSCAGLLDNLQQRIIVLLVDGDEESAVAQALARDIDVRASGKRDGCTVLLARRVDGNRVLAWWLENSRLRRTLSPEEFLVLQKQQEEA